MFGLSLVDTFICMRMFVGIPYQTIYLIYYWQSDWYSVLDCPNWSQTQNFRTETSMKNIRGFLTIFPNMSEGSS